MYIYIYIYTYIYTILSYSLIIICIRFPISSIPVELKKKPWVILLLIKFQVNFSLFSLFFSPTNYSFEFLVLISTVRKNKEIKHRLHV